MNAEDMPFKEKKQKQKSKYKGCSYSENAFGVAMCERARLGNNVLKYAIAIEAWSLEDSRCSSLEEHQKLLFILDPHSKFKTDNGP